VGTGRSGNAKRCKGGDGKVRRWEGGKWGRSEGGNVGRAVMQEDEKVEMER